jgi:hypothetical protein
MLVAPRDPVQLAKSGCGELVRVQAGRLTENEVARLGSIAELLVGLMTKDVDAADDAGAARSPPICGCSPVIRHGPSSTPSLRTRCASLR